MTHSPIPTASDTSNTTPLPPSAETTPLRPAGSVVWSRPSPSGPSLNSRPCTSLRRHASPAMRPRRVQTTPSSRRGSHATAAAQMARYFNANDMHSRIKLAGLLLDHLHAEPAIEAGQLYFVTVVSREHVVPLKEAVRMSSDELHRPGLPAAAAHPPSPTRRIPFIGMVEPGLYKGWGPKGSAALRR